MSENEKETTQEQSVQTKINQKIQEASTKALSTNQDQKPVNFSTMVDTYFQKNSSYLKSISIDPKVLARLVVQASKRDSKLLQCDFNTVVGGVLEANSLGLEVNSSMGEAVLVPFKNNTTKKIEAELLIEYRGLIKLAMNHPAVKTIFASEVYAEDAFSYEYGTNQHLTHIPSEEVERGDLRCFYAIAQLEKGCIFVVLSIKQVEDVRDKYSASYKNDKSSSVWATDFIQMGKKTAIRRLMNFLPKTRELGEALRVDESVQELDPAKKIN